MSRHIPRHKRWTRLNAKEHRSGSTSVRYERGAWWAVVTYRQRESTEPESGVQAPWEEREDRLGPFKRPRNAMMAAEQHILLLRRRHGEAVCIESGDPAS